MKYLEIEVIPDILMAFIGQLHFGTDGIYVQLIDSLHCVLAFAQHICVPLMI